MEHNTRMAGAALSGGISQLFTSEDPPDVITKNPNYTDTKADVAANQLREKAIREETNRLQEEALEAQKAEAQKSMYVSMALNESVDSAGQSMEFFTQQMDMRNKAEANDYSVRNGLEPPNAHIESEWANFASDLKSNREFDREGYTMVGDFMNGKDIIKDISKDIIKDISKEIS